MLTLGIETSGPEGSVALVERAAILAEVPLALSGRRHARTLVAELQALFARVGRRPAECECIAVSIGPGSFTGLRVGVVCAKTAAYAIGCRVVAVDTLEAIASAAPAGEAEVRAMIDAMRGEVFHAHYRRRDSVWDRSGEIGLSPWRDLANAALPGVALTGPALAGIPAAEWSARRWPEACWRPAAAAVALIGEREALAGRTHDLWSMEPLYIRRSAAEEQAERAAKAMPHPGIASGPDSPRDV